MTDFWKAVRWGEQAVDAFRRGGHDVWLAAILTRLATWYSKLAQQVNTPDKKMELLEHAKSAIEEAEDLYRELDMTADLAAVLNNASTLYYAVASLEDQAPRKISHLKKAVEESERATELHISLRLSAEEATSRLNISTYYRALAETDQNPIRRRQYADAADAAETQAEDLLEKSGREPGFIPSRLMSVFDIPRYRNRRCQIGVASQSTAPAPTLPLRSPAPSQPPPQPGTGWLPPWPLFGFLRTHTELTLLGILLAVALLTLTLIVCQLMRPPAAIDSIPVPTPPPPAPGVLIQLPDDYPGTCCTGDALPLRILATEPGYVDLYAIDSHAERQPVYAGRVEGEQAITYNWRAPDVPGKWSLLAVLNEWQASAREPLTVLADQGPPTVKEISSELKTRADDSTAQAAADICPGDEVWLKASVTDDCAVEVVQLWTRQGRRSAWNQVDMEPFEDQKYRSSIVAPSSPGLEYKIYARDSHGNEQETPVQTLAYEPCYTVLYDLVYRASQATWFFYYSAAVTPEAYATASAYGADYTMGRVEIQHSAVLEDGEEAYDVLLTNPPWIAQGIVVGKYNIRDLELESGDYFFARIGFLKDSARGDANFSIVLEPDTQDAPTPSPVERSSAQSRIGGLGLGAFTMISVRDQAYPPSWDTERIKMIISPLPIHIPLHYIYLVVDNGPTAFLDRAVWVDAEIRRPLP
ncbi:MAG: hypothetical protein JXA93_07275 [Anaerolineae bacterium]|nr:hypothetical protein [Anaerolineae bacterium]